MAYLVSYHTEERDIHAWKHSSGPIEPPTQTRDTKVFESLEDALASKLPEQYGFACMFTKDFSYFCSHEEGWVKGYPIGE